VKYSWAGRKTLNNRSIINLWPHFDLFRPKHLVPSFSFPPLDCAVTLSTKSENYTFSVCWLSIFAILQVSFVIMDANMSNAGETTPILGDYWHSIDSRSFMESDPILASASLLESSNIPSSPKLATSVGQIRVTSTITMPPDSPTTSSRSETYPSCNRRESFYRSRWPARFPYPMSPQYPVMPLYPYLLQRFGQVKICRADQT
jgi:hypothetical protein